MKDLGALLTQELSVTFSDQNLGPNGAKQVFLRKGASFMRGLAKNLGFAESHVSVNTGGIAVSGAVYLRGMWGEGNGLYIEISQMSIADACVMYRTISDIEGKKNGGNQFLHVTTLLSGNYKTLLKTFRAYKRPCEKRKLAA
jgi:hypothetical protein